MRILFLHEVNYLTKPIFEMHEFPEHLARLGHEVGFVHFPEGYRKSEIRNLDYRKHIAGRVVSGVEIELFTPWSLNGGISGRLLTAALSYWQFKRVISDFRPDVVVSFSVPTSGWQAMRASKKAKVPYVFRALDVSHKIRKGLFSGLVKLAEKFIYKHADSLSANNPAMLEYCLEQGPRLGPVSVDLPPLDLSHFASEAGDLAGLRSQLGIDSTDKVILYMGSFFYFSGLPEVIRAMETAPQGFKLVLVGGGEQDAELREQVSSLGLEEVVVFAGFVSFQDLPGYLKVSNVAINAMHRSLVSNTAFPNKVIQYLASGVPVVSTRLKGLEMTFGDSEALVFVDFSSDVVSAAIGVIQSVDPVGLQRAAVDLVRDKFDVERSVRVFESRIRELVKSAV